MDHILTAASLQWSEAIVFGYAVDRKNLKRTSIDLSYSRQVWPSSLRYNARQQW
jgi:hypothetical protein